MKKVIALLMLLLCVPVFAEDTPVAPVVTDTVSVAENISNVDDKVVATDDNFSSKIGEIKGVGVKTIDSLMLRYPQFGDFSNRFKSKIDGLNNSMGSDIDKLKSGFADNFDKNGNLVEGFVPLEAKVGRIFISVLSDLSKAIYKKLMPFLNIFIIMLLAFWIFGETWQMMSLNGDRDYWKLSFRITKKVVLIMAWLWVLNNNPATLFMTFIDPLIVVGTAASNLVLNGVLSKLHTSLPDTCGAIHAWVGSGTNGLIANDTVANLLCMPTRITTFFYTTINAGFNLMGQGLKDLSPVIFLIGLLYVVLFVINTWRFIIATLGVIVDLFFVLMFLPFTAVKESFKPGDTTYKGIFSPIWEQLLGLVGGQTLSEQIRKFIGAVIYFIVLSIISAISLIMMAGFAPTLDNAITLIIVGFLVFYMMSKEQINKIAKKLGGEVDSGFAEQFDTAVKQYSDNIWKFIKDKFKGKDGADAGGPAGGAPAASDTTE